MPRLGAKHVIRSIDYHTPGAREDAPLECVCGWAGLAGDYQQHRGEAGDMGPRWTSANDSASPWRASQQAMGRRKAVPTEG